jgi:hypothetical protein
LAFFVLSVMARFTSVGFYLAGTVALAVVFFALAVAVSARV